uniref:DUF4216 domain-containing protein n=1 Tax=Lactuca sativa TaxID=4236 RepID=A0A9R1X8T7_LACSA|nr:hypothetical protein LSAT_V11C600315940 [Lactuca sativa]
MKGNDDPFVPSLQVKQVYYVRYLSMKDLKIWWWMLRTNSFKRMEHLPSTNSSANEVEEPMCLEEEYDDNLDDLDEDGEDEVELCDDYFDDEHT